MRSASIPNRKKILFFTHAAEFGGAEKSLAELTEGLDPSRFAVSVLGLAEGPLMEYFRARGVPVRILDAAVAVIGVKRRGALAPWKLPRRMWHAIKLASSVAEAIEENGAALLYCNSVKAHVIGAMAGAKGQTPVVWHFRDAFRGGGARAFFNLLAMLFRPRIICNSRYVAAQFGARRGARVVYNGLPLGNVVAQRPAEVVRAELELPPSAPVIGMAGRLESWKGHSVFLRAAAHIAASRPDARFLIVGDALYGAPEYMGVLKKLACELGVAEKTVFTGFRPDNYDLLNVMDIYMHPSTSPEPFGRGIIEAMALSKPVVASAHGGPLEILDSNSTGFLVEPGNPDAAARMALQLLDHPEVMAVIGRNARTAVERRFTLKQCVEGVTEILDEILA